VSTQISVQLKRLDQFRRWWSSQDPFLRLLGGVLLLAAAVVIGYLVGQEEWALLAGVAGLLVACCWPIEIAVGFYAFLLPFNSVSTLGGNGSGTTLNWAVGALAAIGLFSTGIVRGRISFPPRAAVIWSLFLLWSLITLLWSIELQASLKQLPTSIALVSLYLIAVSSQVTKKQFSIVRLLAVAGGWLAACYVIYLFEIGVTYRITERASLLVAGRETNPDTLASEFIIPLSLALVAFFGVRTWLRKIVSLMAATTITYAMLLCMSRAAVVAIAVVIAVFLFRLRANRHLFALGAMLGLSLLALPSTFFARLADAFRTGGAGRFDIWVAALAILKQTWITGSGIATFPNVYNQYAGYAPVFRGFGRGAHNTYLEVAVELGIVGFVLLCMALVEHFRLVRQLRTTAHELPIPVAGMEAACWGMLSFALAGDILWSKPFWLCWMLLLMCISSTKEAIANRNRDRQAHADVIPMPREAPAPTLAQSFVTTFGRS
jgi:putative inorganic carbon (hco3(-)) transporter